MTYIPSKIALQSSGADQLTLLERSLRATPEACARAGTVAVNQVARSVISNSCRDLTERYALPASYIKNKFALNEASRGDQVAVVKVHHRAIRLARFDARQLTTQAKLAKGDAARRIGKGRKQAGVSVKVMRTNSRMNMAKAFLVPLRAGKEDGGNGFGVFVRTGRGKNDIKHLYGPAPYQVFQSWVKDHKADIQLSLLTEYRKALVKELR